MGTRSKNIILVTAKSQLRIAYKIYDRLSCPGRECLILAADELEVKDKRYSARNFKYYQEILKINFSQIRQEAYDIFYALANQELSCGLSLRELTTYKGVSMWDLCPQFVFDKLIPSLYYINIFTKALELEGIDGLYLIDDQDSMANLITLLAEERSIKVIINSSKGGNRGKKMLFNYLRLLKKIKRLVLSLILSLFSFIKGPRLNKKYDFLFFAPVDRLLITMLPVIMRYNKNERLVISLPFAGSAKRLRENRIPYLDFYGLKIYSLFGPKKKMILKKAKFILRLDKGQFDNISYRGIHIGFLLRRIVEKAIDEEFPEKMREVDIVRKIVFKFRPRVVVMSDVSFSIGIILKNLSVHTVAVQSLHAEDFILYCRPAADAFIVHGEFWKDFLTKYNIEPEKIWVIGCPRLEMLSNNKRNRIKTNILLKNKTLKKIVVYGTNYSTLGQASIRYQNIQRFESVCEAIKNIKEAYLVVKMHPYDNDYSLYKRIARDIGLEDYCILKKVETLSLLERCDLLITHISGISYEAVLMDKDVILLSSEDDFRTDDIWDFRKFGAAMTVNKPQDLEKYIFKSLFDSRTKSELKQNRQNYIFGHAYEMDGNASNRAKEVINRFCYSPA